MITSALNDNEWRRYARHISLSEIGSTGQQKLKDAKVLVVGAGGLGCPVLQYLAASGVGKIGIVDNDVVSESNLQRQVIYNITDIGKSKVLAACEKLRLLNPYITLVPHITFLSAANALEIIGEYDIVVDGSDNFTTRYLVNDACIILNKPFIFGSIFKFEGQLSVFNFNNGPTYRCLYPEPPEAGEMPNCSESGVLGILPGIIGALQANEAIKLITGVGIPLSGKLLLFNSLNLSFQYIDFELNINNRKIKELVHSPIVCVDNSFSISVNDLKNKQEQQLDFQLIDVREAHEHERFNIEGELIPVDEITANIHLIARNKPVVFYCQKGIRSNKTVKMLRSEFGFENVFSLAGGIEAY